MTLTTPTNLTEAMQAERARAAQAVEVAQRAAEEIPALLATNATELLTFGRAEKLTAEVWRTQRVQSILEGIDSHTPSEWIGELTACLVRIATGAEHPAPPRVLQLTLEHVARDILAIRNRFYHLVCPGFRIALTFTESDVDDFLERNRLKDTPANRANMRGAIEAAIESEGIMSDIREQVADGIESDRADDPNTWELVA